MAAAKGNKNAEKYTVKDAILLFEKAIELTNQKEIRVVNKVGIESYRFDFIGEIARELKTFKDIFPYLHKRFPSELSHLKSVLSTNIEQNCYWNGKRGAIKDSLSIMNLKSNYKWTDRQDTTTNGNEIKVNPINIIKPE